jgi:uncharacterized protein YegJ (DUF2314 family)
MKPLLIALFAAILLIVIVVGIVFLRRSSRRKEPMLSFVMLLDRPKPIDREQIKAAVERLWGVQLADKGEATDNFLAWDEALPTAALCINGDYLLIHSFPAPYFGDPAAAAADMPELRRRKVLSDHKAWMSVDGMSIKAPENRARLERLAALLVAELLDDDCLGIFQPSTSRLVPVDDTIRDRLRGSNPAEDVFRSDQVAVPIVGSDDPKLQQAVDEARRRWPEFVASFELRKPGKLYSAKAPFSEGDETEFMWVEVTAIEGDRIYGKLGNEPVQLSNYREGQKVSFALKDLNDWIIFDEASGQMVGGFTAKILGG